MSNCLNILNHSEQRFQYNQCVNTISYEIEQDSNFTKKSLIDLSQTCFDAYKFHLEHSSTTLMNAGIEEYNVMNKELISLILPFDPLKFSFSITPDPSLHFFIRFSKNISLFVETFLDIDDGHDTYVQILKSSHILFERNCMFDDAILQIHNILSNEFSDTPKTYYLSKDLKRCPPYPQDLLRMKRR